MKFDEYYFKEENNNIRLWIDDLRNPEKYNIKNVIWVKNYNDAIKQINTGNVTWISFDHDLGEEKSGYDIAKHIEELVYNKKIPMPEWQIHSANPPGKSSIEKAMKSAERFNEQYCYVSEGVCPMTDEMKEHFKKRTDKHIGLVQKYCDKIDQFSMPGLEGLSERAKVHDASKYEEPEYTPYVYLTWDYKIKDDGKESGFPKEIKDKMNTATNHHVKNNEHHPEFHTDQEDVINRDNRDKPPEEMVDATAMQDLDIAEMVCDWCAMSEERGNTPHSWADKNVNVRWKFNDDQKKLIYTLMDKVWKPNETKV